MLLRRPRAEGVAAFAALFGFLMAACGSRTALKMDESEAPHEELPECQRDSDCVRPCRTMQCLQGECQDLGPIVCDDGESCTSDSCDPHTGECVFSWITPDADGDGYHAPRPGYLPGEPGSCGDDCDDTSARVFPGATETCDGRDNDCDGIVDNGARYLTPRLPEPVRVSTGELDTSRGTGLAFGNGVFAASYGGTEQLSQSYLRGIDVSGQEIFPEAPLTDVNVMSFGAHLRWSGNSFGAVWTDPRIDRNYEVYFTRFSPTGERLSSDVRVSQAPNFSLHPSIVHDSGRFVVVWDDRRDDAEDDQSAIYGQILGNEGALIGSNRRLSSLGTVAEYPRLAAAERRLGLVYTVLTLNSVSVYFQSFDKELDEPGPLIVMATGDAVGPRIVAAGNRFIVTWTTYTDAPGPSIYGAVLSEDGAVLVAPRPITQGAEFARTHTTVSLGDRVVLLWADTFDGNYELYATTLDLLLEELEPRTRLTFDDADTLAPVAELAEDGTLGVLFDDWRSGSRHVYYTALGCAIRSEE